MGQCYSVEIKLNNVNEPLLVKKTKEYFNQWDESLLEDTIKILNFIGCKNEPRCNANCNVEQMGEHEYYAESDFDASYGWHYAMIDWLEACAEALGDKSSLIVYPDDGSSITIVKDGKAETHWRD